MKLLYWSPIKFLTSTLILVILAQGDLKAISTRYALIQVHKSSTSEKDSILKARDDVYNQLLKTLESFKNVWKQQPDNILALKRYNAKVQNQVTLLREFDNKGDSTTKPASARELKTNEAVVEAPSDPVQPSSSSSSEDEIQKRKQATETFLSGPFDDSKKPNTLEGVHETWIDKSCDLAEDEITKINNLLMIDPLDRDAFEIALEKLYTILNNPSPTTSATTPNGLEK